MTSVTLLDGGMSRELQRVGATLAQPEWSALALMNEPDKVRAAHAAFVAAGSAVITTNSYAVVPYHLSSEVFDARGAELADLAGHLARDAAGDGVRVAGCLPPACGSYIPELFDPAAAERILSVLVAGLSSHVDLWLAETMSSIQEAQVTAAAARGTGKPVWIAFTLRDDTTALDADRAVLRSKESVTEAVQAALDADAAAVLFNCSMPEVMERAILEARQVIDAAGRDLPIGIYANALVSQDDEGEANEALSVVRADLTPEGYRSWARRWIAAGAQMIGGCCGVDSPHIKALKQELQGL